MRIRIVYVVIGFLCLLMTRPALAQPQDPPPASDESNVSGRDLRGTEEEIERKSSVLQQTGRAVLFVPYAALAVVTWPLVQLVQWGEHSNVSQDVVDFLTSEVELKKWRMGLFLQFQTGAGSPAPGVRLTRDDWNGAGSELELVAGYLSRTQNQIGLKSTTAPRNLQFEVLALAANQEDQPFFGIGPDSPDDRFASNQRRGLFEGTLRFRPRSKLPLALTGYYRSTDLSQPSGEASVEDEFPRFYAVSQRSRYAGVEGSIALDTRGENALPSAGLLMRVKGGYDAAQTDHTNYSHYSVELQTFFNIFKHDRVLALRVYGAGMDSDDFGNLPFTELERPGGKSGMRGYNRFRFADRTQLILSATYRYPITTHVIGALFADWGSVARRWEDMRLASTKPSIGLGLGFIRHRPIGLEVAVSPEGWQFYFGIQPVFRERSRRLQ